MRDLARPECCPHCGEILVGLPERWPAPDAVQELIRGMTRRASIESRVLRVLADRFDTIVLTDALIEEIYGRSGGPLRARTTLHTQAYRLRRRLAPFGLTVTGSNKPGRSGYRLCFVEDVR